MSYLKPVPSNLSKCKFLCRNKNTLIWDEICLISVFLGYNFKIDIVIFKISTLEFVKNRFSTYTVNFGFESLFLKAWGPLFLKVSVRVRVHFRKYASAFQRRYTLSLSYLENWELVKSIVGTKFRRSHVCLHSQAEITL